MTKIAVIGAGVSGLSCAWHLENLLPAAQVDVLEATQKVGGVIQTHYEEPFLVELGADNIASLIPDGVALIQAMGLREHFVSPNPKHRFAQVVRGDRVFPIPNGFSLMQPTKMGAILWSPILSFPSKLRVLSEYFVPRRGESTDESVESFAVRRLGRECFDRLVEPIVGGIFTARAETLSMQAAMPQFVKMEQESGGLIRGAFAKRQSESQADTSARKATGARYDQFMAPKQGMSWWMNQIASQLNQPIHHGVQVTSIEQVEMNRWRIVSNDERLSVREYDRVCVTTPSWAAAQIIRHANPKTADLLDSIPYASSAVAVFIVPKSEIRPQAMCFGIVVPKTENRNSLAISLSSEKYAGRCPEDHVLARVFMGGATRPEILSKSDEELLSMAKEEVHKLLGVSSQPLWQKLVRWNQAMPQYITGHLEKIATIRNRLQATPNLHVIGNAFDGVGIPQCIRLARQTAETIAKSFAATALILVATLCIACHSDLALAQTKQVAESDQDSVFDEVIRKAFAESHDGWSVDEVLLHDERRNLFLAKFAELNQDSSKSRPEKRILERLIQLRKSSKLQIKTTREAHSDVSDSMVAAEIASRLMHDKFGATSDQWLVDPELRKEFDSIGRSISSDSDVYSLRKAALRLRKSRQLRPELLQRVTDWHVTIQEMPLSEAMENQKELTEAPGVYIFRDSRGYIYIGQASNLKSRLRKHFSDSDRKMLAKYLSDKDHDSVVLELHAFGPDSPANETIAREAYESELIRSRKPRLNLAP